MNNMAFKLEFNSRLFLELLTLKILLTGNLSHSFAKFNCSSGLLKVICPEVQLFKEGYIFRLVFEIEETFVYGKPVKRLNILIIFT